MLRPRQTGAQGLSGYTGSRFNQSGEDNYVDWMRLGSLKIATIVESEQPFFSPARVFPDATPENLAPHLDWLTPRTLCRENGKLIMPVQSYLLRTGHSLVLIDSCVGNDKSNDWFSPWHKQTSPVYLSGMRALGVQPEDVDFVLCSHLHVDHCGWNTHLVNGKWVPMFPNAKYVFARTEYKDCEVRGGDIFDESVLPIMEASQAVLVETDHQLDDNVWLEPSLRRRPGAGGENSSCPSKGQLRDRHPGHDRALSHTVVGLRAPREAGFHVPIPGEQVGILTDPAASAAWPHRACRFPTLTEG